MISRSPPDDPALAGKRVWLDAGDERSVRGRHRATLFDALDEGDSKVRLYEGEGGHESSYWNSNWKRYMQFYAHALKKCQVDGAPDHKKAGKGQEEAAGREEPA